MTFSKKFELPFASLKVVAKTNKSSLLCNHDKSLRSLVLNLENFTGTITLSELATLPDVDVDTTISCSSDDDEVATQISSAEEAFTDEPLTQQSKEPSEQSNSTSCCSEVKEYSDLTKFEISSTQYSSPSSVASTSLCQNSDIIYSLVELKDKSQHPPPRWGATLTPVSNSILLLFGGEAEVDQENTDTHDENILCDTFKFHLNNTTWNQIFGNPGPKLSWHSSTYIPETNHVIVFGGNSPDGPSGEAHVFDCDIDLWYPLTSSGRAPGARMGHSATLLGDYLVVFGGNCGRRWFNDIHVLNITKWRWSQPQVSGPIPDQRVFHSAVAIDKDTLVIFGGNGPDTCFNDVYVLKHTPNATGANQHWTWSKPRTFGIPPSPRCGHTSVFVASSNQIVTFGGWDPEAPAPNGEAVITVFSDTSVLNTTTWEWSHDSNSKQLLTGHAAALVDKVDPSSNIHEQCLYLFGGQGSPPECRRNSNLLVRNFEHGESVCEVQSSIQDMDEEKSPKRKINANRRTSELAITTPPIGGSKQRQSQDHLSSRKESEKVITKIASERQVLAPRIFREENNSDIDGETTTVKHTDVNSIENCGDVNLMPDDLASTQKKKQTSNSEGVVAKPQEEEFASKSSSERQSKATKRKGNGAVKVTVSKRKKAAHLELFQHLLAMGIQEEKANLAINALPPKLASPTTSLQRSLNFALEYLETPACSAKRARR